MNPAVNLPVNRTDASELAAKYERDGFCVASPVLPADLIKRTVAHMDAVVRGDYETGRKPMDAGSPNDPPTKLRKIDQPHFADRTIFEALTYPPLGQAIGAIMGAKMIQVWAVQLLYKPPGGDPRGSVGLHQDFHYWKTIWTPESNLFTAWLALSNVREECGPMHFAAGSQRWGLREGSDFFAAFDEEKMEAPPGEEWRDESAAMPAGAFSLHHRLTWHGSRPNLSQVGRYSFAIHLRTEDSTPMPTPDLNGSYDYAGHLDDEMICPVIFRG